MNNEEKNEKYYYAVTYELNILEGKWTDSSKQRFLLKDYRCAINPRKILMVFENKDDAQKLIDYNLATMPKEDEEEGD